GVDVADADDAPAVHEERLDLQAAFTGERVQPAAVERARQRLDAQVADQGVRLGRFAGPENRTKAARIAQSHNLWAEADVYVVMLAGPRARRHQPPAARHAPPQ